MKSLGSATRKLLVLCRTAVDAVWRTADYSSLSAQLDDPSRHVLAAAGQKASADRGRVVPGWELLGRRAWALVLGRLYRLCGGGRDQALCLGTAGVQEVAFLAMVPDPLYRFPIHGSAWDWGSV